MEKDLEHLVISSSSSHFFIKTNFLQHILKEATPYRCGTKICKLFLAEMLQIIKAKPDALLNQRSNLISK